MANKPKMPKVQLKVSLPDIGMILGSDLPSLAMQWPEVRAKLKALKDEPEIAAFVKTVEEMYRRIST